MDKVEMVFWDVQHGNAIYIKSPNGKNIIIDLGVGSYSKYDKTFSPLEYLFNNYNIKNIDYLVITHPHMDHIDDVLNLKRLNILPTVLEKPERVLKELTYNNIKDSDLQKVNEYWHLSDSYSAVVPPEYNPYNPLIMGGLFIRSFQPKYFGDNLNNYSIITIFEFAGYKVVVPGDNEKIVLDDMMKHNDFIDAIKDANILLAPHHGRESGYNADFMNIVKPQLTIVSDGDYCDTSANERYSAQSSGFNITKGSNHNMVFRRCLTTNSDGAINVDFGQDGLRVEC